MSEHEKLYQIYETLLLALAIKLYPVPATYIFKIGEAEVIHQISGYQIRFNSTSDAQEILEDIMAVLDGRCNVVSITGMIGNNRINFIIGLGRSPYELTRL